MATKKTAKTKATTPATKAAILDTTPAKKAKRASLNPQPLLDAKYEAVKAVGAKLAYKARVWTLTKGEFKREFTSLELSKLAAEELAALIKA
jgi:hypothetical protein